MTVSMFKGYSQLLNQNINWNARTTPERTNLMQEGIAAREMKYVCIAELIRKAR